ncbi:MAG: 3-phosphoserine/phosphohydroxythreonine transaminase [Nocardiopsaceae bacterium]|jgi:phosphoserine aminotransferase|nr:3-phosphoserine/phosphohydroxythreonine transaminase [Nocardiopsaceae bacterium]
MDTHTPHQVYNFSAGPAVLPEPVLLRAQAELPDWHGTGMSVMEMSHRGSDFVAIAEHAEARLRELMAVPDNYRVLFLQGGATGQFAAVPMNLSAQDAAADYVITGMWSKRAHSEASKYLDGINVAASTSPHTYVPPQRDWALTPDADYVHITLNETIQGVRYAAVPDTGGTPLVADVSSIILSEPIDVSAFGVLYGGAQKNIGPSGLVVVIAAEDMLGRARSTTPQVWNWFENAKSGSMINTPPTYAWYIAGLVFDWVADQGGVDAVAEVNRRKAAKLYGAIDASGFYANPVDPANRSLMNVPFTVGRPDLEPAFLAGARAAGLVNLEGHRSVGGMRASIYNAMPEAGVDTLIDYMKEFEAKHG